MRARTALAARVRASLRANPVVALLGPRQCGKTTLARELRCSRRPSAPFFDCVNRLDSIDALCNCRIFVLLQNAPDMSVRIGVTVADTGVIHSPLTLWSLGSRARNPPHAPQVLGEGWNQLHFVEQPPGSSNHNRGLRRINAPGGVLGKRTANRRYRKRWYTGQHICTLF
jgi:hypothetical protein